MRRILITGASGLLGRPLLKTCRAVPDWEVTGTALHRVAQGVVRMDLMDIPAIHAFLDSLRPDAIIHAAAERRPDVSEKDPGATHRLNVEATAAIAAWVKRHDAYLLYLSSDYVFDGTKPPYRPEDPTCPVNTYGQSKLEGERVIQAAGATAALLRVPILYGCVESLGESSVTVLVQNMLKAQGTSRKLPMEHWATRYPTLTDDVAVVIRQMLERQLSQGGMTGAFHWSGNEPMTKYDMALLFAQQIGFDVSQLLPDTTPSSSSAPRPKDCHLDSSRLESLGIGQRTPFAIAVPRILKGFI